MNNETAEFLNSERNNLMLGRVLPSQYMEQCNIARIEGRITNEEYSALVASMPAAGTPR